MRVEILVKYTDGSEKTYNVEQDFFYLIMVPSLISNPLVSSYEVK